MTKILDCTIRDGGYLNNWNFTDEEFLAYANLSQKAGFDYFEIGYRSNVSGGRFRKCLGADVSALTAQICGLTPLVMLNCAEFSENLFSSADKDFVSTVRVACHNFELLKAFEIVDFLTARGYEAFLHIMNVKDLSENDFEILKNWNGKTKITSLYFADSYGSFFSGDVEYFYKKFLETGFKNISFHAHNNLQMAFSNSLKASELGAYSFDITTGGIGRGGGNLAGELCCAVFNKKNPAQIYEIYSKILEKDYLKKIISGISNLHPSKVDEFLRENLNAVL